MTVSDRGRLPADLREAYIASLEKAPTGSSTAATKAPARRVPAKKAPLKKAPARKAPAKAAAPAHSAPAGSAPAVKAVPASKATPVRRGQPAPTPVPRQSAAQEKTNVEATSTAPETPEARMTRLEERLSALTARVAALEKPAPAKPSRFLRRQS